MNYLDIKKKHGIGTSDNESNKKTTSSSSSYSDIAKKHGVSYDVDEKYISTFFSDYNKFASAGKDSSYSTWKDLDLGSKVNTVRGWLYHNKKNFDEETYKNLSDAVDSMARLTDYYSQFKSEDEYKRHSIGWLNTEAETTSETASARQEYYQSNVDRVTDIEEDLPWYAKTWLPNFVEDIFLSKENEALRDEAEALEAENRQYMNLQGKLDKHYIPITDEVTQTASKRDYSNASAEELNTYDAGFRDVSNYLGDGVHYLDDEGNVVNSYTGKVVRPADEYSKAMLNNDTEDFYNTVIQDKLGMFLSASEDDLLEAYNRLSSSHGNTSDVWANTLRDGDVNGWKQLTDDEITIYYYKLNTEGQEAAYKFLEDMTPILTRRETEQRAKEISEAGLLEQIALNGASIPMNVIGGAIAFGADATNIIRGEEINPYSRAHAWQNDAGVIRAETADDLDRLTGNIAIPWLDFSAGDVYQSLMSGADSYLGGKFFGSTGYGMFMGMGAASSTAKDLYERGASNGQIIAGSLAAGIAEGIFEKYSIEKFVEMGDTKSKRDFIINILKQGGIDASEEAFTEIANTITDAIIMGSQSNWVDGETFIKNVVNAALGGFISGGAMGAVGSGASYAQYAQQRNAHGQDIIDEGGVDTLKALALEMSGVSKKTTKLANKVEAKASAKNVGKLSAQLESSITEQNRTDIKKALVEKGLSEKDAKRVAEYLGSTKTLTAEQKAEVEGNEKIKAVMDELLDNSKSTINERARKLIAARLGTKINAENSGELSLRNDVNVKEKVSESGKTTFTETDENGKEVTKDITIDKKNPIAKVKYVDGERIVYLNTDHGTVEASNVKYANEEEALLYEAFTDMNPAFANAVIKNYDGSVPIQTYINGMREGMILYGMHNFNAVGEDIATNTFLADLSEADQAFALKLGRAYAKADAKKANKDLRSAIKKAAEKAEASKGASSSEATQNKPKKGTVRFEEGAKAETHKQHKRIISLAKHLAKAIGIDIVFYDSRITGKKAGQGANGYFDADTDTIYLDLQNATDDAKTIAYTLSHELVHFIKKWSPQKFNTFAEFLMEQYASHGVSAASLLKRKMVELNTTDADLAYEEMIADACETMLLDSNAMVKLMELRKSDLELFEKIKLHVLKILNDIREAYKSLGYEPTSDEAKALLGMKDVLEQFYSLFEEAAVDATKNYQAVKSLDSKVASDSNIKKQAKALQRKDPTKLKEDDLINLLQYSKSKLFTDGSYIPVRVNTPQILIAFAKEMEYTLENFPMAMSVYKARQAVSNIEEWDGDPKDTPHDLEPTEVVEIIRAMNNPSYLVFQTKNERFAEIVKFDKGKEKAYAIIDFFDVNKNAEIMNGYKGGKYNILVTVYPSEDAQDLKDYLKDKRNKVITGEEMKKKGLSQRGLGSYVPAHLNDSPFFEDIITEEKPNVKKQLKKTSENGELSLQNLTADELLSKWQSKRKELSEASYEQDELEDSEGYKTLIKTLVDSGASPDAVANYNAWNEKTGYSKLVDRVKLLAKEARELSALYDKAISDKYAKEEQEAIAKSGLTEADYFRKQAVKEFGYTPYFYDAGYLLPNGRMLNFSGEKGQHYGMRGQDHRAIGTIYANLEGSEAMLKFMEEGNIRVMAETPGIDLSVTSEPTKEQYDTISRFVTQSRNKGYFCVDLSDTKGNVIGSLEYENSFSSVRVINDIKTYFKTGEIREQSSVAKFHYQKKKDSQGNILSEGQQEFFKDSKVRDKNGNLLVMYHGTPNAGFTKFREGSYFTEHKWYADRYQNRSASSLRYKPTADNPDTYAVYLNIKKPFDTRNPEEAQIFNNEYLGHYGMGTPLMESGLPDWLDGMDLQEFIEEMGYDSDGLILDEGSVGGYGDEVVNRGLSYVIFDPAQAKNIDNKSPTSDPDIHYQKKRNPSTYAPTFYSQMGREIDAIKMDKIGATSLVNYLKGKGIKHDEIKWSGIEAFLEGKKSVTKAELQEFIAGSQLTIEEEMSGTESFDIIKDGEDYIVKDKNGNVLDTWRRTEAPDDPDLKGWMSDEEGDIVSTIEEIREYSSDWYGSEGTRWSQYRLEGGTNYRELVFKMPNSSYTNQAMRVHWGEDAEGVLAHARIQDMTTADGKEMLFIEEIQSDWHNEGQKTGYESDVSNEERTELIKLDKLIDDLNEQHEAISKEKGQLDLDYFKGEKMSANEYYEKASTLISELEKSTAKLNRIINKREKIGAKVLLAVPDAPFRNNYHEYVLKRLLRMAAEEGYDSIGWTPAEIQDVRWADNRYHEEGKGKSGNLIGYTIEYDQEMPKFLRKYGKKWGATVGKVMLDQGLSHGANLELLKKDLAYWQNELSASEDSNEFILSQIKYTEEEIRKAQVTGETVWSMDITEPMEQSVLYEGQAKFQKKKVSNRTILANALDTTAQNDIEKNKLTQYKEKIALIESEEEKLAELRAEIDEIKYKKSLTIGEEKLSVKEFEKRAKDLADKQGKNTDDVKFTLDRSNNKYIAYIGTVNKEILSADKIFRTKEETEKLKSLQFEANQTANRINTYDRQLLNLESTTALKGVLEREKQLAYKRAEQKGKEALDAYREKMMTVQKEQISQSREIRKAAVAKVRETRDKQEAKKKLFKLVLDTVRWITHPSKTEVKCPDMLKAPYKEFLESIDLDSKRALNGGEPTKNDLRVDSAMNSLANTVERVRTEQVTDDGEIVGFLDLPEDFVKVLRNMAEDIKKMMPHGEAVVNTMSSEEIKQLIKLIRTLNTSIKEMNSLHANLRFANAQALGNTTTDFLDSMGEADSTNGVKDFVEWDNALPYYAFKRFGEGGESIFESLMDAQDKLARLAKIIFDFKDKTWTDKEANAWGSDTHTIDLPSGKTISLTTADAMGIYCLARRDNDHGKNHLIGGGVRIIGLTKGATKAKDVIANLTEADVDAICASLTDRPKAVAEAIQEFMSTVCADWGNEISMKRFLTKDFGEKRYYPIESDNENLNTELPEASQGDLYRLLNISATKSLTEGANNRVVIRNIFDVFTNHASDMARLNAFGMALLDYMKWLNYRERTVTEDGQVKTRGVRQSMNSTYGEAAKRYVMTLIKDVNGRHSDNGDNRFLMQMMRFGKTAAVGNNLRVAFLQFTSYPRASMVLSNKSLALGVTKVPQIEKAKKYCGIALWKSFGFYDTNIARSIEDQIKGATNIRQKIIELSMKAPELADAITWGALWNACEYEVAKTTKNKVGSEEFYQEVGRKLREVVYATQVVDSILTRSQIMRSKSGLTQTATAYMSEPTLTANILMDAGFEFEKAKRITGNKKEAWKKTRKIIGKAIGNYCIIQLITSLVESLADVWRDDDDEEFAEKFLEAFKENLITNIIPFNKLPIISHIAELILSRFGIGFVSSDNMATTWIKQIADALDVWAEVLGETFGGEETSKTVYNAIYKTAKAISSVSGISVSGAMREVVALWNNTAGAYDSTLKIRLYESTNEELGNELYKAIVEGNERQVDSIKEEFEDDKAMNSAIRKALRTNDSRIKEAAQADIDGDVSEYHRIVSEILAEGNFSEENIKKAIEAEINELTEDEEETPSEPKKESIYEARHYYAAVADGNASLANEIREDIISTDVANGEDREDAEKSFETSFRHYVGKKYKGGEASREEASNMLTQYGGYDSNEAYWKLREWDFDIANGEDAEYSKYTDFYEAVKTGKNIKAVIKEYTDNGVKPETLASQITNYYKPLYKEMSNAERAGIKGYLLNAYTLLGYDRSKKSRDIDKWLEE